GYRAVRRLDLDRGARQLHRMQNAEADAVAVKRSPGRAVHLVDDRPVRPSLDRAPPSEVNIPRYMLSGELDNERVAAILDRELRVAGLERAPISVAHCHVEATDDLHSAGGDIAQVAAFQHCR